jgi:hypothetical protein
MTLTNISVYEYLMKIYIYIYNKCSPGLFDASSVVCCRSEVTALLSLDAFSTAAVVCLPGHRATHASPDLFLFVGRVGKSI